MIIAESYKIKYKDAELFADLAVEKPIIAEQNRNLINVQWQILEPLIPHNY